MTCPWDKCDFTLVSNKTVENLNLCLREIGRDVEQWHFQLLSQSSNEVIFGLITSEIANRRAILQVLRKIHLRNISGDSNIRYAGLASSAKRTQK